MAAEARDVARPIQTGYRPALDGLRGISVSAVLLFHAGIAWLPGGWLGVDAFFVLSGYLITGLLLGEHERNGRIRLAGFWSRRVRRLLPALLLMLATVVAAGRWLLPTDEVPLLRGDALSALFYVANWRMIDRGTGYVALTASPSPLQHTWSLAIEEQFYLLWPLLVVGAFALATRRRVRAEGLLLVGCGVGVVASAALMAWTYHPLSEPGRAYYGSDTRAFGLLTGCALAAFFALRARHVRATRTSALVSAVAVIGMGAGFSALRDDSPVLYRGGLLAVVLAVTVVVAQVEIRPTGLLARALSLAPLPALGRISYGVYLWHWPVFLALNEGRTELSGGWLLTSRLAATLALALASYRLVEQPIRSGRWPRPARLRPVFALGAVAAVGAAAVVVPSLGTTAPGSSAALSAPVGGKPTSVAVPTPAASFLDRPGRPPGPPRITIFGDSVARSLGLALPPVKGMTISTKALPGCGIARLSPIKDAWTVHAPYARCPQWDKYWSHDARITRPDVAFVLLDRWELMDRKLNGRWQHVGEPAFDAYLNEELERMVAALNVGGDRIVLATAPYNKRYEKSDGGLYPEDEPSRVDAWNKLLRATAARHPGKVSILDLASRITPDGKFTWDVDGIRLRSDGLHLTESGVREWIAPWLLPRLAADLR